MAETPAPPDERPAILPAHIEQTVSAIAALHADHDRAAGWTQRTVAAITARLGRPAFVGLVALLTLAWIALNLVLRAAGHPALDPQFAHLSNLATVAAFFMTALILTTQRHDDQLGAHREQLTLELAILSEQKSAKIIELLEKFRRDDPTQSDHHDHEAQAMATPADPQAVLDAIKTTQGGKQENQ